MQKWTTYHLLCCSFLARKTTSHTIEVPAESTLSFEILLLSRYSLLLQIHNSLTSPKSSLAALHIPLHTITHNTRRTLSSHLVTLLRNLNSSHLFANIEYEIDELRRDITVCTLAKEYGIKASFVHDRCVVEPGVIQTKGGKTYTVSSAALCSHHKN
jgi:hypothetical protein